MAWLLDQLCPAELGGRPELTGTRDTRDSPRTHLVAVEEPRCPWCHRPSGWILREGESLACLRTQRLPLRAMPLVSHGGLGGSLADKLSLPFGCEIHSEVLQCHFLTKSSLTWSGPAESLRSGRLQEAAEHGQKDQGFGPPRACVGPAQPCAGCFTYSSNLSSAPQGSPL